MTDRTTDAAVASSNRILGLFAKSWEPGTVKTRLAKTLGDQRAADIYLELLTINLLRFSASGKRRVIGYSPSNEATRQRFESFLQTIDAGPWELKPQSDGGLGERMSCFFDQQFESHGEDSRVILIGSDALRLLPQQMERAFEALQTHDVVFGPSTDGGYYLVGMSRRCLEIFQNVTWSTETVLAQSLAHCETAGYSVAQLEPLTDIDHEADLLQEVEYFENLEPASLDADTQNFLDKVRSILGKTIS